MTEYVVGRTEGRCKGCERALAAGETFYTALFERPDGFERRDFCEACWPEPPQGVYCFFRTKVPAAREGKRRQFVDDEVMLGFFERLAEQEQDAVKAGFRFALMLILMRRRLLKYEGTQQAQGREYWQVRQVRDGRVHRVLDPQLDEARMQLLAGEIGVILAAHAGEDDGSTDAESADSAGEA